MYSHPDFRDSQREIFTRRKRNRKRKVRKAMVRIGAVLTLIAAGYFIRRYWP